METVSSHSDLPRGVAVASPPKTEEQAIKDCSFNVIIAVSAITLMYAAHVVAMVTLWTFERVSVRQISPQYRVATWAALVIYASLVFLCYDMSRQAIGRRGPWTRRSQAFYKAIWLAYAALVLIFSLAISVHQRSQPDNPLTTCFDRFMEGYISGFDGVFPLIWFWNLWNVSQQPKQMMS